MRLPLLTGLSLAALALSGCATGPNYHAPTVSALAVPDRYAAPAAPATTPADLSSWWTTFDDPLLTRLVADATAANLDIKVAQARLRQAHESLVQSRAALLPSLSGSAGVTRTDTLGSSSLIISTPGAGNTILNTGTHGTQLSLGANASWQADVFGGTRRSIEAYRASEDQAFFNLVAVRTSAAGEVATNYVNARLAQARLAIARDTLKTQDDNLQIAGWRVQAGLVSSTDREQARAQRAQTAATIPLLETSFRSAINRLAVLSGRAPGALEADMAAPGLVPPPIPAGPDAIAAGVPADTLRQRPDVRAAERQLAAATAQIGVAQAQLYPALNFTGALNSAAANLGNLGNAFTSSLFAGLTQTIFDGGRLRSQLRSAKAGADLAFANYKSVVLQGLEDADNALQSVDSAKRRRAALTEAVDASTNAAILARSQYRSGLTDFLTLLQSEQSLLSARDSLASAQADKATALIQLYLAVGGGWQPTEAKR